MQFDIKTYFLIGISCLVVNGCASYFYSQVPEPFTSNAETLAIDNQSYQNKLQTLVNQKFPQADIKIVTDHFNVLIAGQVESQKTKNSATVFIKKQQYVKDVYNYTTISKKPSYSSSSLITTAVNDRLNKEPDIDSKKITVVYIDGVVCI
jgi:osmotically-inducible protein OsmY